MIQTFGLSLAWLALTAGRPPIEFTPAGARFAAASDEYRAIWDQEGERIIAVMEEVSGVAFPSAPIEVIVSDTPPMTAFDGRTIRLRARYSPLYKKATLIHELGHRLGFTLRRPPDLDDHRLLYLFLYDVWTDFYGEAFAERMAGIERRIGPAYASAWDYALSLNREQRQQRLGELRSQAAMPAEPEAGRR